MCSIWEHGTSWWPEANESNKAPAKNQSNNLNFSFTSHSIPFKTKCYQNKCLHLPYSYSRGKRSWRVNTLPGEEIIVKPVPTNHSIPVQGKKTHSKKGVFPAAMYIHVILKGCSSREESSYQRLWQSSPGILSHPGKNPWKLQAARNGGRKT